MLSTDRLGWRLFALAVSLATATTVLASRNDGFERRHAHMSARAAVQGITSNGKNFDGQSFDYVIVGGGTAGLVVASRLSEDSETTVAVIEAGESGEGDASITTPSAMLYNSSEHTAKDWADNTVNQTGLGGRSIYYPRGKVLGGSSAINGMYLVRQPAVEQEGWANLVSDISPEASKTWGWDNMFNAMKKSETFTAARSSVQRTLAKGAPSGSASQPAYDASSHGTEGNIHASWPAVSFPSVGAFLEGASDTLGLPINADPDSGNNTGPFLSTSAINPSNWTRSFSRTGYIDPVLSRSNLHILVGHQATKILFDRSSDTPRASTVQFAKSSHSKVRAVKAKKEVILSAGVVGTPQLLQLSGVGDKSVLDPLKIEQVANVPGVGFHMQDHLSGAVNFAPADGAKMPASKVTGNAKQDSFVNSAVAYVPISKVADAKALAANITSSAAKFAKAYKAPATVQEGYRAALDELADNLYPADVPAIEILWFMAGGAISVQCGLQHPTSQGSVKITSTNPFEPPEIDPAYVKNEIDMDVLRSGCQMARKIATSKPLTKYIGTETQPGANVTSDADWNEYIQAQFGTEYHPSSSCAMLPLDHGGVVDDELRVYNTKGLRIADASVPPITFSQHLLTVTYGIGEIAADLIQQSDASNAAPSKDGLLGGIVGTLQHSNA